METFVGEVMAQATFEREEELEGQRWK